MVKVGWVRRAHGLGGEVRVEPLGIDLETLASVASVTLGTRDGAKHEHDVVGVRPGSRGALLVRLSGVPDRTAAEALHGADMLVDEVALPALGPDAYYYFELVGLRVEDPDGQPLGQVTAVFNAGASDVAVVDRAGSEWMFPVVRELVCELDVDGGRVVVDPIPGLLEGGE